MTAVTRKLCILQVAPSATGGGGEQMALLLHRAFRRLGHRSMLAVGRMTGPVEEDVYPIPGRWTVAPAARVIRRLFDRVLRLTGGRGSTRLFPLFEALAFPRVAWDLWRGHEDYTAPGSHRLLQLAPEPPDIVLLHNLHARWTKREAFFDLRFLPQLSRALPVILFPHDPWLLTGHCAHPIECARWRIGCGRCPDLDIYPAIRRDATAANFRRKRKIIERSRLHLAAPSHWLLDMFEQANIDLIASRRIRNGVDTERFSPGGRRAARAALGLDPDRRIIMVSGNRLKTNPWKGYGWLVETAERLGRTAKLPAADFLCVGDEGEMMDYGGVRIRFAGFIEDPSRMPAYYQAADIYLHPSRADTAPLSVLEAMASGLPVVATAVGGIPEQVEDGRSGFLAAPGDAETMAARIGQLLADRRRSDSMGKKARARAVKDFDFKRQSFEFIDWMTELAAPA
jgi:glycosyltransferase involved in cell wall biosynthesis